MPDPSQLPSQTVTSYCRICPALCGITVTVEDDAVTRIVGDRDHPLSRGYMCPKGRKMGTLADDPDVLDHPMMRDASGQLVRVDWETALGDLADRLTEIRDRAGPYAIGMYSGTFFDGAGRSAAMRLMSELGSPSFYSSLTIDSVAKVLVPKLMAGRERLYQALDLESTTLLLVIGENMVVSHGGYAYFPDPIQVLRGITKRGEVWVLDPRRTETARNATRHLTPRSSSDFAVLAHLVREVLRNGADTEYLRDHARNVAELRRVVEPFDLKRTVELTGLRAEDLTDLLAAVRRHRHLAIVTGTGVSMAATGNVTEWMAYTLQIVTGSFERPGGRWFNHGAGSWPSRAPARDESQFAPGPRTRPDIGRIAGQYPSAVLAGEIEAGNVEALLVVGGNPIVAFPQPERLARAMERLQVLAVWDVVHTATVEHATHVFPSPTALERADMVMPTHLSMMYAQYTPAVLPLRGERRPIWWSIGKAAQRMGLSVLPGDRDPDACTDDAILATQVGDLPVSFAELRAAGRPLVFTPEEQWVKRLLLPEGRWDLAPSQLVERMQHATTRPQHSLVLGNRREVQHCNSTLTWGVGTSKPLVCHVSASPADADAAGLQDGDLVTVTSPHGSVSGVLRVDDGLAPGTVTVPHGFATPNVGNLTAIDHDVDPLTGMPMLVGVPVSLAPGGKN